MMAQNPGEIGIVKIFTQFVPSPFGRYENKLELDSTRHDSVRFNGRVCNAVWTTAARPRWPAVGWRNFAVGAVVRLARFVCPGCGC